MKVSWQDARPFVIRLACWSAGAAAAGGVFRAAVGGQGFRPEAKGMAAVAAATLLLSLVIPALSITFSLAGPSGPMEDLRRWGLEVGTGLGGAALGIALFALFSAPAVLPAAIGSLIVVAAASVSFGALARALTKVLPGRHAGASFAAGALLLLVATPWWSGSLLRTALGPSWGKWLVGASPFLAAALPWTHASGVWTFDPRTGALYDTWIGTDVPLAYPSWIACAVGHVLAGAAILAVLELARVVRRRAG